MLEWLKLHGESWSYDVSYVSKGRLLLSDRTLSSYDIRAGDTLHVIPSWWLAGGWRWPGRCRHRRGGVGVAFVCRRHGVVALRAAQPRPHASMAGGVAFPDGSVSVYASPALQQPRLWYDSRPRTKAELASVLRGASSVSIIPLSRAHTQNLDNLKLKGVVTAPSQRSRT